MSAASMGSSSTSRRTALAKHAVALGLFVVLACVQTWPLVVRLTDGVIGQASEQIPANDVSIFLWNFWWVEKALFHLHQSPVYCDLLARPGPPAFVFPTLSLMNSLLALPLIPGLGLEGAYNVLILAILALTGWSAYLLVHDMTGAWLPAFLAGLLYGTSPLHIRVAGQLNVFTLFWIPLVLLAARRFVATGRVAPAIAMGICFLCNALSAWYHAVALGILLVLLGAVKIWQTRSDAVRRFERARWPWFAAALAVYVVGMQFNVFFHLAFWLTALVYFMVLLFVSQEGRTMQTLVRRMTAGVLAVAVFALPVVWPMYRAIQSQPWLRETKFSPKVVFSADLASYFFPGKIVDRIAEKMPRPPGYIAGPPAREAADAFPGFVAWLILIAAVAWRLRRGRRGGHWLFLAGAFVIGSLGPALKFGGVIGWKLTPVRFIVLPGMACEFLAVFESIRVFLRFAFPAYLCAAVFVGIQAAEGLASLETVRARRWAIAALAAAGCLLVVERLDLPRPVGRVPDVAAFEWLRKQSEGAVLLCPVGRRAYENLYAQTRHERPMVNPYISRRPEDLVEFVAGNALLAYLDDPLSTGSRTIVAREPHRLERAWIAMDARWIVVDGYAYRGRARLQAIDSLLRKLLSLSVVYEDAQYRVYGYRHLSHSQPDQ